MKKKKYYNKHISFLKAAHTGMFTMLRPRGSIWNSGKALKSAMILIGYGASNLTTQKRTGLSLRRVKTIRKMYLSASKVQTMKLIRNSDKTVTKSIEDSVVEAMVVQNKSWRKEGWGVVS